MASPVLHASPPGSSEGNRSPADPYAFRPPADTHEDPVEGNEMSIMAVGFLNPELIAKAEAAARGTTPPAAPLVKALRPGPSPPAGPRTPISTGSDPAIRQTLVEPIQEFLDAQESGTFGALAGWNKAVAGPEEPTVACQPTRRPPVPVLCILDDGQGNGELVWLRKMPAVIGRSRGDVKIVHDPGISDPHAELFWRGRRLYLQDLHSQGGTFVRISKARVRFGQEIRLGHGRFRFEEPGELVTLDGTAASGARIPCGTGIWIGQDPGPGGLCVADSAVSGRHARLAPDFSGHWYLTDDSSTNGTWIRIDKKVPVDSSIEFFLGEQRFRLRVPPTREG